jgi:hypothetical protein
MDKLSVFCGVVTFLSSDVWTVSCWMLENFQIKPFFYVSTNRILSQRLFTTFDVHRAVHRNVISIVKPTRCTNISNLFWNDTLHVSDGPSDHHQKFKTVHAATGICQTDTAVWQMPVIVCTVLNSWWGTEGPSETCRVSFQNKINLIHWCILLVLLQK